jgi:hypothetical protein
MCQSIYVFLDDGQKSFLDSLAAYLEGHRRLREKKTAAEEERLRDKIAADVEDERLKSEDELDRRRRNLGRALRDKHSRRYRGREAAEDQGIGYDSLMAEDRTPQSPGQSDGSEESLEERHARQVAQKAKELLDSCLILSEQIKKLNPVAAKAHQSLLARLEGESSVSRLSLIQEDLKLSLGREITLAARNSLYREEAMAILAYVAENPFFAAFGRQVEAILSRAILREEDIESIRSMLLSQATEYERMSNEARIMENGRKAASVALEAFSKEGSGLLESPGIAIGQSLYLSTPSPDFRVEFRLDRKGGLTLKLVRVAADLIEANIPLDSTLMARAASIGEHFRREAYGLVDTLNRSGLSAKVLYVQELGQVDLPVLVDSRKKAHVPDALAGEPKGYSDGKDRV